MINLKYLLCRLMGHNSTPPIIEVWEASNSMQKSVFLCRRCLVQIGEKPFV